MADESTVPFKWFFSLGSKRDENARTKIENDLNQIGADLGGCTIRRIFYPGGEEEDTMQIFGRVEDRFRAELEEFVMDYMMRSGYDLVNKHAGREKRGQ